MIGVVIPAHNEAEFLGACLRAVLAAAAHPALAGEPVCMALVLDDCSDASAEVAASLGIRSLHRRFRNVGMARAAGAESALAAGCRWLAFTDADTRVAPCWLAQQLADHDLGADAVCGTVSVEDWSAHGDFGDVLRSRFDAQYLDAAGHRHIHGANLGVSAAAYSRAGGFLPMRCGEDVALVNALTASGANISWSARPRVVTSARKDARARGGFGDTLIAIALGAMSTPPAMEALRDSLT